jgi:hypothetical protein
MGDTNGDGGEWGRFAMATGSATFHPTSAAKVGWMANVVPRPLEGTDDGSIGDFNDCAWADFAFPEKGPATSGFAAASAFGRSHFGVEQQVQGAGGAWDFASRDPPVFGVATVRGRAGGQGSRDFRRDLSQLFFALRALQDGQLGDGSSFGARRRLGNQNRLVEDVQHVRDAPSAPQVRPDLLAGNRRSLGVLGSTFWPHSFAATHDSDYEDGCALDSTQGIPLRRVYRRFFDPRSGLEQTEPVQSGAAGSLLRAGAGGEPAEKRARADSDSGVSGNGVSTGVGHNRAAGAQNRIDVPIDEECCRERDHDDERGGKDSGDSRGRVPGDSYDAAPQQQPEELVARDATSQAPLVGRVAHSAGGGAGAEPVGSPVAGVERYDDYPTRGDAFFGNRRLVLTLRSSRRHEQPGLEYRVVREGVAGTDHVESARTGINSQRSETEGKERDTATRDGAGGTLGQLDGGVVREQPGWTDPGTGPSSPVNLGNGAEASVLDSGTVSSRSLSGGQRSAIPRPGDAPGLGASNANFSTDNGEMGHAGSGLVCDERDGTSAEIRQLAARPARCWDGCVQSEVVTAGSAGVPEPAILADREGSRQDSGGAVGDGFSVGDAGVAGSALDQRSHSAFYRLADAARRLVQRGAQQRSFHGPGFDFTATHLLEVMRQTLIASGQAAGAVEISVAAFVKDDPEKEALREYCQFLEHMHSKRTYTQPTVADFVNYAELRLNGGFRAGQKLQEASVSAVFTKLFKVGNLLTNRSYGSIEDCQAIIDFKRGVHHFAQPRINQDQTVPDIRLIWDHLAKLPNVANLCEHCVRAYLALSFASSIPLRPDCISKILLEQTVVLDDGVVSFRMYDRKKQNNILSPPFKIRDGQLAALLTEYKARMIAKKRKRKPDKAGHSYLFGPLNAMTVVKLSAQTVSKMLRGAMSQAGIAAEVEARRLRDMTATFLLVATDDEDFVMRAGGWKSKPTLMDHYIRTQLQVNKDHLVASINVSAENDERIIVRRAHMLNVRPPH